MKVLWRTCNILCFPIVGQYSILLIVHHIFTICPSPMLPCLCLRLHRGVSRVWQAWLVPHGRHFDRGAKIPSQKLKSVICRFFNLLVISPKLSCGNYSIYSYIKKKRFINTQRRLIIPIFQHICLNWVKKRFKPVFFVLLSTVSYFPLLT